MLSSGENEFALIHVECQWCILKKNLLFHFWLKISEKTFRWTDACVRNQGSRFIQEVSGFFILGACGSGRAGADVFVLGWGLAGYPVAFGGPLGSVLEFASFAAKGAKGILRRVAAHFLAGGTADQTNGLAWGRLVHG